MRTSILTMPVALLLALACSSGVAPRDSATEIRQADLDFAAATAATGAEGWTSFFLPDGVMFQRAGKVEGREAIRAAMAGAFGPDRRLEWAPVTVVASASGDLGYSIGRWSSIRRGADRRDSTVGTGNYVTIWRRDTDGRWRVAADIGNEDPPPSRP